MVQTETPPPQGSQSKIPSLIKRNTVFLASAQAIVGSTFQLVPSVAGLIILRLTGNIALVGLGQGMLGISRMVIAYPAGKVADALGRRAALLMGILILCFGAVIIYFSVVAGNFLVFAAGLVLVTMGQGAIHQMRIAAADMYPPKRKAEGISYVMSGSAIGALGGPVIVTYATDYSRIESLDPYATPWLFIPALAVVSALLILLTRPDPRDIAKNLGKYYPGIPFSAGNRKQEGSSEKESIRPFLSYYPIIVALVVTSLAWGNMNMMMAMVAVVLNHHGFDLPSISISVAIHILGMYALSIPLGRITDRWGRKKMLILGSALSGVGAFMTPLFETYEPITIGIFLVGVGWSAAIVASTALVGDVAPPLVRGRVLGIVELTSGILSVALPVAGGWITGVYGFFALGVMGLGASIPTIIVAAFLRERSPAVYDHKMPILSQLMTVTLDNKPNHR